jgi:glycosyltransferase involved in cell wall biosynthesis
VTRPLRLLFFGDASSPHTARWCRWFAEAGHEVWLASDAQPEEPVPAVTLLRLGASSLPTALRFPYRLAQARRWVRELRPDVAHGHYIQQYGYLAARCGAPVYAVSAWGSDVLRLAERGARHERWTRETLHGAALVTCDSREVAELAVALGAEPEAVMEVVFGVDLDALERADGSRVRRELGIEAGEVVALSARNLEPLYRPELVAGAMAAASAARPGLRGVVVGGGSRAAAVEAIASRSGGRVLTLPRQPESRVADFFAAADVFVSVPETDATSVSLLQAMAAGAVPVVSDLPANREWVADGETGIVLQAAGDAELERALADALVTLASDDALRARLGRAAARSRVREVGFASQMARVEAAYRRIAGVS